MRVELNSIEPVMMGFEGCKSRICGPMGIPIEMKLISSKNPSKQLPSQLYWWHKSWSALFHQIPRPIQMFVNHNFFVSLARDLYRNTLPSKNITSFCKNQINLTRDFI